MPETFRRVSLRENETVPIDKLDPGQLAVLASLGPALDVRPAQSGGGYDLSASSYVGGIEVGSLSIEVRPKIGIPAVLFLVSYALDPAGWRTEGFQFARENRLLDAVIPGFLKIVQRAIQGGLLHGYHAEEETLQTVRGRLRLAEQIRRHFGRAPPVEVRYDEFTDDLEENRRLRAAMDALGRVRIRNQDVRRSLRELATRFAGVRRIEYARWPQPPILFTRLNEHYRPPLALADLILQSLSIRHAAGGVRGTAFLLDMNRVFENFVVVALREALAVSEGSFPQGARGRQLYLDEERRIRIEPDLSWWFAGRCVFVGDVKYKRAPAESVPNADLYQLLAYTVATGLPGGMLIYAAGERAPAVHTVSSLGKRLAVRVLDVAGSPEEILGSVSILADEIREMACHVGAVPTRIDRTLGGSLPYEFEWDRVKVDVERAEIRDRHLRRPRPRPVTR